MLTDNPILIGAAQKNYDKFLVPTSLVDAKKVVRHYTNEEQADLDIKTSVNKIGEIVNLSQEHGGLAPSDVPLCADAEHYRFKQRCGITRTGKYGARRCAGHRGRRHFITGI